RGLTRPRAPGGSDLAPCAGGPFGGTIGRSQTTSEGDRDGVWDRASLPGRDEGAVRGDPRGGASDPRQPSGGPVLPRGRPLGRRLDDRGVPRLEGELGAIPRRGPDAPTGARRRGRLRDATTGDRPRGRQPAALTCPPVEALRRTAARSPSRRTAPPRRVPGRSPRAGDGSWRMSWVPPPRGSGTPA